MKTIARLAAVTLAAGCASLPEGRYEGLGRYTRPVSTRSPAAQAWFDQGLNFLFAFNHDEAIRSFERATALDPEGNAEAAFAALREAVRREDALRYDEPPDWIQPIRHVLGAALLHAGRAAEAEAVYREDLARWPENGWSLLGLSRSLNAQGRDARDVERRFREAWKDADIEATSSCLCLPLAKRRDGPR